MGGASGRPAEADRQPRQAGPDRVRRRQLLSPGAAFTGIAPGRRQHRLPALTMISPPDTEQKRETSVGILVQFRRRKHSDEYELNNLP